MAPPALALLAEKRLPYAIKEYLIAYEARTELIAVVTGQGDVDIYRQGGQRAFHIGEAELSDKVSCLQWISDGEFLIVGTADGTTDWISVRTGRVLPSSGNLIASSTSRSDEADKSPAACIGGCANVLAPRRSSRTRGTLKSREKTAEEWLEDLSAISDGHNDAKNGSLLSATDLPSHLAVIDIEEVLPRLSPIPAPAKPQHGFQQATAKVAIHKQVHAMVTSKPPRDSRAIETIFTATADGNVQISVDRVFEHRFPPSNDMIGASPIKHCAHPQSGVHALLRAVKQTSASEDEAEDSSATLSELQLSLYRIPFSSSASLHTQVIISRTIQFYALGLYLQHCVDNIANDWKILMQLPTRFIENINETLSEKGEVALEQHLYNLAMTGHCSPTVIEWLRDEFAERGHKRYDHAITSLYQSLGHLLRINILPALERLTLTASSLRGLATYYEGSKKFNVDASAFSRVIDAVTCIQLIVHEAVQILGQEERQFRAFSKWLRTQVDLSASEPGSQSALELAEREAMNTDVPKVLAYLEGPFTSSRLQALLVPMGSSDGDLPLALSVEDIAMALKKAQANKLSTDTILNLPLRLQQLQNCIGEAFALIQKWQDATWTQPDHISIPTPDLSDTLDVTMSTDDLSTFIDVALVSESRSELVVSRTRIDEVSAMQQKGAASISQRTLIMPDGASIVDVEFLSDSSRLLLLQQDSAGSILILIPSHLLANDSAKNSSHIVSEEDVTDMTLHAFSSEDAFVPGSIQLGEREHKRSVLVMDKSRRAWKLFDLQHADMAAAREESDVIDGSERLDGDYMAVD